MTIRVTRRATRREPLPRPRRAGGGSGYHRLVVALSPSEASARAVRLACELAADSGVHLAAVAVVEVPLEVPLASPDERAQAAAREAVRTAQAVGATYGIGVDGVVVHARDAGEAIVGEVRDRRAEAAVVAAEWPEGRGRNRRLPRTTDHVLRHAPCRVLLVGEPAPKGDRGRREPVFRAGRPSDYWPEGTFVDPEGSTSR